MNLDRATVYTDKVLETAEFYESSAFFVSSIRFRGMRGVRSR